MMERTLPTGWMWTTLGDVAVVSPRDPALVFGAQFVTMSAVEVGSRHPVSYEQRGSRAGVRARGNDVLFARITPCLENGKVALLPPDAPPTGGSTEFIVIRPTSAVDPVFLYYWCLHPDVRDDAQHQMAGVTGRMRLAGSDLSKFDFPLPPIAEQRRIVEVLEDHLSRLDVAEQGVSDVHRRTSRLVRRLIASRVGCPWPAHWSVRTVAEAGRIDLGRQRHPDWHDGEHMRPYLRVANVFEDRLDLSDVMEMDFPPEVFERFRLVPGDILLNEGQSPHLLGRPAMYRGNPPEIAFTNSLIRFRAVEDVLPEWALMVFRHYMHSGRFTKEVRITTNIAHLSVNRFKTIEFPVPPTIEQQAILSALERDLEQARRLETGLPTIRSKSAALRRSLLRAAFNGELVDQDPTDEPADLTLATIKDQQPSGVPRRSRKAVAAN